jgi:diguanylate cyclase (GGDEF)-like protein/PAS domain S-box-containing protein
MAGTRPMRNMPKALRLLLVEDNAGDAMLIKMALQDVGADCFSLFHCNTFSNALDFLAGNVCDAVLLDLDLPDALGLAALRTLRERFPLLAVVVLTDRDNSDRQGVEAIAAGAQDYLIKGSAEANLLDRSIRHAVERQKLERSLLESQNELRALFDNNPFPVWVFDVESLRFLAVNDAAVDTYGYSKDEFLKMTIADIRIEQDIAELRHAVASASESQASAGVWRHRRKDGSALAAEISTHNLSFAGHNARLVLARDVTVERQAIDSMQASERRFRELFEHSLSLICTHDMHGVLLSVNPATADALGYRIGELIGLPLYDLIPPDHYVYFQEYLSRILNNKSDSGLLYLKRRDGDLRVWQYSNHLSKDSDGSVIVDGNAQDVTESRRYEHELRNKQAELEAVNDASPLGLFRTDDAGHNTYVNRSYERLSGLRTDQALGEGWVEAIHPDDRARVSAEWSRATAKGEVYAGVYRYVHSDRRVVWVSVQAAPMIVDGHRVGYIGSVDDMTLRHDAEVALRRSEQRIRTIADALPAMVGYIDAQQRFIFANAEYERVYGRQRNEVVGRTLRDIIGEEKYERRKPYIERALHGERVSFEDAYGEDEEYSCLQVTYIPQLGEDSAEVLGVHMMVQDITSTKVEETRLVNLAEVDSLTGLSNRAGFLNRLGRAMARSDDQKTLMALMYLDIDDFKRVNDTYGHATGDSLLRAFATRLSATLRASDVVGRLGGDEFTAITEGVKRPEYAAAVAAKVVSVMRRPFILPRENLSLSVSASIGLAFYHGTGLTTDELLKEADAGLYKSKEAGRNTYTAVPMHKV